MTRWCNSIELSASEELRSSTHRKSFSTLQRAAGYSTKYREQSEGGGCEKFLKGIIGSTYALEHARNRRVSFMHGTPAHSSACARRTRAPFRVQAHTETRRGASRTHTHTCVVVAARQALRVILGRRARAIGSDLPCRCNPSAAAGALNHRRADGAAAAGALNHRRADGAGPTAQTGLSQLWHVRFHEPHALISGSHGTNAACARRGFSRAKAVHAARHSAPP